MATPKFTVGQRVHVDEIPTDEATANDPDRKSPLGVVAAIKNYEGEIAYDIKTDWDGVWAVVAEHRLRPTLD